MNDHNTNEQKLKQVMADVFGVPAAAIDDSSSLETIERWDSTAHLNLILVLEEQFDVRFNEDQMGEITTYPLVKHALKNLGVDF
jgi:acyl carrier protein